MPDKINILGTEYAYSETTDKEDTRLCEKDGYCDSYGKKISIETDQNWDCPDSIADSEGYMKKVKRHEIVHAYFAESGLSDYCHNEQLVDWIAFQFPKLLETFKEVGAM